MTSMLGVGQKEEFLISLDFRFLLVLLTYRKVTMIINWFCFVGLIELYTKPVLSFLHP